MTVDTAPARPYHVIVAGLLAFLLAGAALLAWPSLGQAWGARPWVQGVYLASVLAIDSLIALFLALQVLAGAPTRSLGWLAGAYVFGAVTAVGIFFSFPGLVHPAQSITPELAQMAAALWLLWHTVYPGFVLLALGARAKGSQRRPPAGAFNMLRIVNLFPLALGLVLGLAALGAATQFPHRLPAFVDGDDYSRLSESHLAAAVVALNVVALTAVIYLTRLREVLSVWLAFSVFAFLLETLLSLAGSARYSGGWYVGRLAGLVSSGGLMIGLMIEQFKLYRDAEVRAAFHEQEAIHDPLTGLFNRRYLMDKLPEEIGRAKRYRYPVSVLMLDLDHFKRINDQHGHKVGDDCLRALARMLSSRVHRFGDFTVRYGGEEFVIVLPETGLEGAVEVAEVVRQRVEAFRADDTTPCAMTVSIGVASVRSADAISSEALLEQADRCLYQAKERGRNQVAWPLSPLVSGMAWMPR